VCGEVVAFVVRGSGGEVSVRREIVKLGGALMGILRHGLPP
jgi:hypothetical protein